MMCLLTNQSLAINGEALVNQKGCPECHDLRGPAPSTIAGVLKRKAPDLFYAGSKFQERWLTNYLQKPIQLRPAGTVYLNFIKTNKKGEDEITEVPGCESKLNPEEAASATQYLMTLKDNDMATNVISEGKFSKARARKLFTKDEGCNGCHQVRLRGKQITGGVSCPDLFNAGDRLNPDWVFSFIQDPQHWDPKVWMPGRELDDAAIKLLTQYLMLQKGNREEP